MCANPINGKKIDAIKSPKNIKNLFRQLSDKYPKIGCIKEEQRCDKLSIKVDKAREMPKFADKNGIIGLTNPEYASTVKCPAHKVLIAFLFVLSICLLLSNLEYISKLKKFNMYLGLLF